MRLQPRDVAEISQPQQHGSRALRGQYALPWPPAPQVGGKSSSRRPPVKGSLPHPAPRAPATAPTVSELGAPSWRHTQQSRDATAGAQPLAGQAHARWGERLRGRGGRTPSLPSSRAAARAARYPTDAARGRHAPPARRERARGAEGGPGRPGGKGAREGRDAPVPPAALGGEEGGP